MLVYVLISHGACPEEDTVIGVCSSKEISDHYRLGYDISVEEFELDEVDDRMLGFYQYKREPDCQEEVPPPSLETLHSEIKHLLSRLIMFYNGGADFSARKLSRQLLKRLDTGKSLGYNMEPIESYIDQRLKDNHQSALSQQDFDVSILQRKTFIDYQAKDKPE
jgi:hypothetical protein